MAYPYKKMTSQDCDYIRSVTAPDRVWAGAEIASEYYRDEMPEYGVYQPDLYVEVVNKEEVSAIMAYAYKENIPVVCRGAGTGLAGGATCKYGGIMLSIMRMNKIFPIDRKNQTITAQPGALLIDIQAAAAAGGLFYPPDPGEKTASIGGNVITNAGGMKAVRYGLTRDFVRCIEAVMPDGSIMNFSSNVVKNTTGYDVKDLIIGSEGTLCILTEVTLKLLPAPTCTCTLVMPFKSLEECADMVPKVLELPFVPTAIEFLERELIDIFLPYAHFASGIVHIIADHRQALSQIRFLTSGNRHFHLQLSFKRFPMICQCCRNRQAGIAISLLAVKSPV